MHETSTPSHEMIGVLYIMVGIPNMQPELGAVRSYSSDMTAPQPIDLPAALDALTHLPDRTPDTPDETRDAPADWAASLVGYRDGAVFIVDYAGSSEWERHRVGDEFVQVIEGATTMTLHVDGHDHAATMTAGQFIIVPQGVWHRFDTPDGAKIMTITPQPTDHTNDHPSTLGDE